MAIKILAATLIGLEAELIEVEADAGGGDFGNITIVGLPDATVSEARERIKSALRNSDYEVPRRKITVNLAPANLKKHGASYDLAMALSILTLKNNFQYNFKTSVFVGELSLSGELRPVPGILAIALKMKKLNIKNLFLPLNNKPEAELIKGLNIFLVTSLQELADYLSNKIILIPQQNTHSLLRQKACSISDLDFSFIKGQEKAKRVLEIAITGGHNVLLIGPPGAGKSLLAQTSATILPILNESEILELTNIYRVAGELKNSRSLITARPFRAPHHNISISALIGGGSWPKPGEVSLAHRGILFLDELPEFSRHNLAALRQPLEKGFININRANGSLLFPCRFILIAAMNPCPCGYYGDKKIYCSCRKKQITSYRHKISGPLIDRFDLSLIITRPTFQELNSGNSLESSEKIRKRVINAQKIQTTRYQNTNNSLNAYISSKETIKYCQLSPKSQQLLNLATEKFNLSARTYYKILKIARTIADLENSENILTSHLAEALQYRPTIE